MKYATEMGSGAMLYVPSFIKIGSDIEKLIGFTDIQTEGLLRVKPSAWGYNRATLFLGDINTGTWSSRLGESQI
jgi:hypothetical protein